MTVGQRIKARRKDIGISADILADQIGVSRSTVFRYENGDIEKLPLTSLEPIAKALHTSVQYLMGWTEDPGQVPLIFNPLDLSSSEADLLVTFRNLNNEGQSLVIANARMLESMPEYRKE